MQVTERPIVYKEYKKVRKVKSYTALLKVHFILLPSRPVQSNTVSVSLGSIQPRFNLCVITIYIQISSHITNRIAE